MQYQASYPVWRQFLYHLHSVQIQTILCLGKVSYRPLLILLNTTCPVLANSVDPDQLASEEANWSESGNQICPAFANSVDPDQLSSEEANWSESAQFATETWYALPLQTEEAHWSGSTQFAIKYVNLYQQPGSSKLIGWKLGMGVES